MNGFIVSAVNASDPWNVIHDFGLSWWLIIVIVLWLLHIVAVSDVLKIEATYSTETSETSPTTTQCYNPRPELKII